MHSVVCLKQILDPEVPPSDFRLDPAGWEAAPGSAGLVISIFDENALEVALQLREREGQGKITALSLGAPTAVDALRKALSMRADGAILIPEEDFPGIDAQGVARVLAAAIRRLEPVDLVFCGRETGDWQGGLVGGFLAAELDRPCVSFVAGIEQDGEKLRLRRQTEDGWEVVECAPPLVVTVTNDDTNVPRIPKVKDNMLAFRKQIPSWTAEALGLEPALIRGANAELEVEKLYIPVIGRECRIITGDSVQEKVEAFVNQLAALRVI